MWKETMKKLLLLDADVIIDLHTLSLFEKTSKAYDIYITKEVFDEADHFKKDGVKKGINIRDKVTIVESVDVESLAKVNKEAREARLSIDPGESTSIAYINQTKEEISFCSCDKAAIKLISYMELETRSISLEKVLRDTGYSKKNLYPRHYENIFKACIKEGKALRIQFKKLV